MKDSEVVGMFFLMASIRFLQFILIPCYIVYVLITGDVSI